MKVRYPGMCVLLYMHPNLFIFKSDIGLTAAPSNVTTKRNNDTTNNNLEESSSVPYVIGDDDDSDSDDLVDIDDDEFKDEDDEQVEKKGPVTSKYHDSFWIGLIAKINNYE